MKNAVWADAQRCSIYNEEKRYAQSRWSIAMTLAKWSRSAGQAGAAGEKR
jgi:hypothetical protein